MSDYDPYPNINMGIEKWLVEGIERKERGQKLLWDVQPGINLEMVEKAIKELSNKVSQAQLSQPPLIVSPEQARQLEQYHQSARSAKNVWGLSKKKVPGVAETMENLEREFIASEAMPAIVIGTGEVYKTVPEAKKKSPDKRYGHYTRCLLSLTGSENNKVRGYTVCICQPPTLWGVTKMWFCACCEQMMAHVRDGLCDLCESHQYASSEQARADHEVEYE